VRLPLQAAKLSGSIHESQRRLQNSIIGRDPVVNEPGR
jgi:Zn-dependent M32 family carboxypeptidase